MRDGCATAHIRIVARARPAWYNPGSHDGDWRVRQPRRHVPHEVEEIYGCARARRARRRGHDGDQRRALDLGEPRLRVYRTRATRSARASTSIASDLPLQGSLRPLAVQIVAAIRLELKQMNFKIGDKTITYASCDDSTAAKGSWDSQTCTNNANGYKTVKNLLGLIGTFNSGCAEIIAPIVNRAPGGGIPMVSPANTYVGLTKPSGVPGEPNKYFPSGKRNYARVAVPDNFQGAADATFLQQKGIKSVYVLNDGEAYGTRHREQLRERREGARHHGARQRQVGRQPARLPVALPGDRHQEPAGGLPRRPRSRCTAAS